MAGREPLELSIGVRFLGGLPIYAPSSSGPGYPALIREVEGQHPSGRREHSPTARGGRLKPGTSEGWNPSARTSARSPTRQRQQVESLSSERSNRFARTGFGPCSPITVEVPRLERGGSRFESEQGYGRLTGQVRRHRLEADWSPSGEHDHSRPPFSWAVNRDGSRPRLEPEWCPQGHGDRHRRLPAN